MGLSADEIAALLIPQPRTGKADKTTTIQRPRSAQVGPLKYYETPGRCASRGCSSPTPIKIRGVFYCSTHALYELNREIADKDPILKELLKECTCKAGNFSRQGIHNSNCDIYSRLTELEGITTT